ncbi:type VI secretion system baseplate subunit TssG [Methylomonas sp. AM2-LC]|uniref:type VI secretion system baseplate subunit TssG n=1 Tax=Methylomonas sp. AM2-LC TaxID=3153301 RepID=UPI003264AA0E
MSTNFLISQLEEDATRFDFFEALRLIECLNADKPRLGTSLKVSDDPVRLTQFPELEFPASTLNSYTSADHSSGTPHLAVNFMGLFGPNGPLPLHITEYVRERLRHNHDPTFSRFADIFHHRMISLFYRAWANTQPTVQYDRPESDRFKFYIGSFLGIANAANQDRDALNDRAKLFYSGHFSAKTKHAAGLLAIVADALRLRVRIEEFVGEWMAIMRADQTRLGMSADIASLGQSALIGASVWGCQHKFRLVLGPLKLTTYLALLPGEQLLTKLIAIVSNYIGNELVWDTQLILESCEVPRELALGKPIVSENLNINTEAQLGWSMWLGPRSSQSDADDLMLNPFFCVNTS